MLNHVILVGRLTKTPDLFLTEAGKKVSIVTLAVGRPYKNLNGEYETDFLDCTLWSGIAESTAEYCKKGDVVGVKGRLQSRIIEKEDGTKYKKMEVIADKITFLSSAKDSKKDNEMTTFENDEVNDETFTSNKVETAGKKTNKKDNI